MFGKFMIVDAQGVVIFPEPMLFEEALRKIDEHPDCSLVAVDAQLDGAVAQLDAIYARLGWRFGRSAQEVADMRSKVRIPTAVERELNSIRAARAALERWSQRDGKRRRRAELKRESDLAA
jgi:hypothetical protein